MTASTTLLDRLAGRLVVSCQAYPGEPMRDPDTMARVAQACVIGGAAGIRAQGLADLRAMRAVIDVPLIGLVKEGDHGVYITPTLQLALDCVAAGSDIVAIDGTARPRPDGHTLAEVIDAVHRETGALVMADCSTLQEAVDAAALGADLVGTTLAGYTEHSVRTEGPDLALLRPVCAAVDVPVVAEGRFHTPDQARAAIEAGAHFVVVGTAITHPSTLTGWFASAVAAATHP